MPFILFFQSFIYYGTLFNMPDLPIDKFDIIYKLFSRRNYAAFTTKITKCKQGKSKRNSDDKQYHKDFN